MKKILFLSLFISLAFIGSAQVNFTASNGLARDTVTNTATETWSVHIPGSQKTIGIQVIITKISGTAGGTIVLQASTDGTNYFTVPGSDTATATNVASQSFGWEIENSKWPYYQLLYTGTGTMSVSAIAKAVARKQ